MPIGPTFASHIDGFRLRLRPFFIISATVAHHGTKPFELMGYGPIGFHTGQIGGMRAKWFKIRLQSERGRRIQGAPYTCKMFELV